MAVYLMITLLQAFAQNKGDRENIWLRINYKAPILFICSRGNFEGGFSKA